ncbi:hypothetical protein [Spirillospora sp. CA-294931]|uniref:hypothetical protein n=1 Tax=Spirillospora sp. CA-294931 TaxID=3240042 RepID=UPI003D8AD879
MLLSTDDRDVLDAIAHLCRATAPLYDAVVYTEDTFNPCQDGDRFRDTVADQQHELDKPLRAAAGLAPILMPSGLNTTQRVRWTTARLATKGLITALA